MPITDEDRALQVLDDADCRRLLAGNGVGRLGFSDGALPAILPVSYHYRDGDVLIPSDQRASVVAAVRRAVVVLEIGALDPGTRTGWSVTAVGPARVIIDPLEVAAIDREVGTRRPPAPSRCYISVRPQLLQGWRMQAPHVVLGTSGAA